MFQWKNSKVHLTGMDASNPFGEKIPMFVIGKSASPRCFKYIRNLPCRYSSQKKVWMDGTWMDEEWLHGIDQVQNARKKSCCDSRYLPCPSRCCMTESYRFTVFATKYHFLYTVDGSEGNQVCFLYYFLILLTKLIESQSSAQILLQKAFIV